MHTIQTLIREGDCLEILKKYPDDFFDLIITSPPYADSREKTYGGIKPDKYAAWFLPRSEQFFRVLKPTGTFILNIKERVVDGERHIYVIELILELRKQGWLWTEEYIWHKKNSHPGKWPNRFRDAWERCLQFNKSKDFKMYQDNVMIPMGEWAKTRLKNLGKNDVVRFNSQAQRVLRSNNPRARVTAINGCCNGQDENPDKGDYLKLCGQRFWEFISGNENLYVDIIEPLGYKAQKKNEQFSLAYDKVINRFTQEFAKEYCDDHGAILWDKLVRFNSGKRLKE